jgi:serine/threonine protein phosphatase PrpC
LHLAGPTFRDDVIDFFLGINGQSGALVGENAPQDANGNTPAAYCAIKKVRNEAEQEAKKLALGRLHSPGDPTVSPLRGGLRSHRSALRKSKLHIVETPVSLKRKVKVQFGHSSLPGYRVNMEDAVILVPQFGPFNNLSLFAVMDGHGGAGAARFVADELLRLLESKLGDRVDQDAVQSALKDSILEVDRMMSQAPAFVTHRVEERAAMENEPARYSYHAQDKSGTTIAAAVVAPGFGVIANVGDSRAILFDAQSGQLALATRDHSLSKSGAVSEQERAEADAFRDSEVARIEAAGGTVTEDGRVKLNTSALQVTRALGDFEFKTSQEAPLLISEPDLYLFQRTPRADQCLVLACDGVWDVMSNEECVASFLEAVDHVGAQGAEEGSSDKLSQAAYTVALQCLESYDNISIVAVRLLNKSDTPSFEPSQEGKPLEPQHRPHWPSLDILDQL